MPAVPEHIEELYRQRGAGKDWPHIAEALGGNAQTLRRRMATFAKRNPSAAYTLSRRYPAGRLVPPPLPNDRRWGWRPRRAEVLRRCRWSWQEIAEELDYSTAATARGSYEHMCAYRKAPPSTGAFRRTPAAPRLARMRELRAEHVPWREVASQLGYRSGLVAKSAYYQERLRKEGPRIVPRLTAVPPAILLLWEARKRGRYWREIAAEQGYSSGHIACHALLRFYRRYPKLAREAGITDPAAKGFRPKAPPLSEDRSRGWRVRRAIVLRQCRWNSSVIAEELGYPGREDVLTAIRRYKRRQEGAYGARVRALAERTQKAISMRQAGHSFAEIAEATGQSSEHSARRSYYNDTRKRPRVSAW